MEPSYESARGRLTKKTLIKSVVAIVIVGAILVSSFIFFRIKAIEDAKGKISTNLESSSTVRWINSFLAHQFEQCDMYSNDKIRNSSWVDYVSNYTDLYILMDGVVNSISNMAVTGHVDDTFTVEITYKPYGRSNAVRLDSEKLKDLGSKYANNEIFSSDLQDELKKVYSKSFKETLFFNDEAMQESTITVKLYEKVVEDKTYVYGTKNLIDALLLNTNLLDNIEVYEKEIKGTVQKYLVDENRY